MSGRTSGEDMGKMINGGRKEVKKVWVEREWKGRREGLGNGREGDDT